MCPTLSSTDLIGVDAGDCAIRFASRAVDLHATWQLREEANVFLFIANPCEQDPGKACRAGEGRHDHAGQGGEFKSTISFDTSMIHFLAGNWWWQQPDCTDDSFTSQLASGIRKSPVIKKKAAFYLHLIRECLPPKWQRLMLVWKFWERLMEALRQ